MKKKEVFKPLSSIPYHLVDETTFFEKLTRFQDDFFPYYRNAHQTFLELANVNGMERLWALFLAMKTRSHIVFVLRNLRAFNIKFSIFPCSAHDMRWSFPVTYMCCTQRNVLWPFHVHYHIQTHNLTAGLVYLSCYSVEPKRQSIYAVMYKMTEFIKFIITHFFPKWTFSAIQHSPKSTL